jgi:hypothetical protein
VGRGGISNSRQLYIFYGKENVNHNLGKRFFLHNLLADPQSVLNRWKNFFNEVLNIHGVYDVRQMDIQTAEPLVPEPSLVEVEIAIGNF